jgi:hypothetical protein
VLAAGVALVPGTVPAQEGENLGENEPRFKIPRPLLNWKKDRPLGICCNITFWVETAQTKDGRILSRLVSDQPTFDMDDSLLFKDVETLLSPPTPPCNEPVLAVDRYFNFEVGRPKGPIPFSQVHLWPGIKAEKTSETPECYFPGLTF